VAAPAALAVLLLLLQLTVTGRSLGRTWEVHILPAAVHPRLLLLLLLPANTG
jgi:hypothetical protein